MAVRFFNSVTDTTKLATYATALKNGLETLIDLPTHTHYLSAVLMKEGAAKPGLSKASKIRMLAIAAALTTPKYRVLCHFKNENTPDATSEIIKEFGRDVEAQRALIWASKQKPYWKLWKKRIEQNCRRHYPEIAEAEWK